MLPYSAGGQPCSTQPTQLRLKILNLGHCHKTWLHMIDCIPARTQRQPPRCTCASGTLPSNDENASILFTPFILNSVFSGARPSYATWSSIHDPYVQMYLTPCISLHRHSLAYIPSATSISILLSSLRLFVMLSIYPVSYTGRYHIWFKLASIHTAQSVHRNTHNLV